MRKLLGVVSMLFALGLGACGGSGFASVDNLPEGVYGIDLWVVADDDVWIVDGSATIHRTDGETWTTLTAPAPVACVFALSPTQVWLCADDEVLFYDGTFTSLGPTNIPAAVDVWAADANNVFVVGSDAAIGHYDGASWERTLVGSPFFESIWGTSASDVWAVGTFDVVHWDGAAWTEVTEVFSGGESVWASGPSDVWVMSGSDPLHFDGTTWTEIRLDDNFIGDLDIVHGFGPNDVWAAGSAGSIAHHVDSWDQQEHQSIGAPYLRIYHAMHGTPTSGLWLLGTELGEDGNTPLFKHRAP